MANIKAYYRLSVLSDEMKTKWGIKLDASNPRFDCVASYGYWGGIDALKTERGTTQGQFKVTLIQDASLLVNAKKERLGDFVLKGAGNINLTSVHILNRDEPVRGFMFGTGEPPKGKFVLRGKKENPFLPYENDAFMFIIKPDFKQIEMIVLSDARHFVSGLASAIIENDEEWEAVETARLNATPFFNY